MTMQAEPAHDRARPLTARGAVELASIDRSGVVESRHLGAAAVVDSSGEMVRAVGDVAATVYPRSTLKPLQALAMLELGAHFANDELALATASHCGSPEHVAVVERMLRADGRDEHSLQCPPQWPLGSAQRAARQSQGLGATRVTMNCSGKHAGFLRASDAVGGDPTHYLDLDHAIQRHVTSVVERYTGDTVHHTSLDGCGAPLHATSVAGLAVAIARLVAGTTAEEQQLMGAVAAEPWAIDGRGRTNTVVI
jgi:L-asparaginase II